MTLQESQPQPSNIAEYNRGKIHRLALEVEKLVGLLEEQRLLEPSSILELRQEQPAFRRDP